MTAHEITLAIEAALKEKGMSKTEFYMLCGITPATFSNWRKNVYFPSKENLDRIQSITGLSFGVVPESNYPQREQMRQEMRILFDAAEDAPTSAILEAAALLMRYKEQNK